MYGATVQLPYWLPCGRGQRPQRGAAPTDRNGSAVHVATVIDVNDVHAQQLVVDAVDDPVAPASSGAQAGQLAA